MWVGLVINFGIFGYLEALSRTIICDATAQKKKAPSRKEALPGGKCIYIILVYVVTIKPSARTRAASKWPIRNNCINGDSDAHIRLIYYLHITVLAMRWSSSK